MITEPTQVKMVTTLPGNAESRTLVDTFVALAGTPLNVLGIERITFDVKNDQTATIRVSGSDDGTTYNQFIADIAVSASAAGAFNRYDWFVAPHKFVKVVWVNGATPQGTYVPVMQLEPARVKST